MDRETGAEPEGRDQGAKPQRERRGAKGLHLIERDGHWHIHGTLKVKGRSIRVRQSTGYAATPQTRGLAEEELEACREEIRARALYGEHPSCAVSVACEAYLNRPRERPLGPSTVNIILEVNEKFALRPFKDIDPVEWTTWVDVRQEGNKPATRERFIATVLGFLSWSAAKPRHWIPKENVPTFERDRKAVNPNTRKRRRVGDLTPELIALMVECAEPHLKGQIAALYATGARGSSILHGCRVCDLSLVPGRESLSFHRTKTGRSVDAALDTWSAGVLRDYMSWRGNWHKREDPLFLTKARKPYTETHGRYGTQMKSAWNTMKKRSQKALRRAAARSRTEGDKAAAWERWAEARLLGDVTPHWFRHKLATEMLSATGNADIRSVMEQGGWMDPRTVIGYTHDVPDRRRAIVNSRALPGPRERKEG